MRFLLKTFLHVFNNNRRSISTTNYLEPEIYRRHQYFNADGTSNFKVGVFWDIDNAKIPGYTNGLKVIRVIRRALRSIWIKGPITFVAYGNFQNISKDNIKALSDTGVKMSHLPAGDKINVYKCFDRELSFWVSENPPPAHILLISDDLDSALCVFAKLKNHDILLAYISNTSYILKQTARVVWRWSSLMYFSTDDDANEIQKRLKIKKLQEDCRDLLMERDLVIDLLPSRRR